MTKKLTPAEAKQHFNQRVGGESGGGQMNQLTPPPAKGKGKADGGAARSGKSPDAPQSK